MTYSLHDLMELMTSERGEAVHLHDGEAPVLELQHQLHRIEGPPLAAGDTLTLFRGIAPREEFREFERTGLAIFTHKHTDAASFQIMVFREAIVSGWNFEELNDFDPP